MNRLLPLLAVCILLPSCQSTSGNGGWIETATDVLSSPFLHSATSAALSQSEVSAGLREALQIGTNNVVGQLGVINGFTLDPKIHIPLPGTLGKVHNTLSSVGLGGLTEDLELRLNRAAEAATPKAKALFISAIQNMTISDAQSILSGPNNAATQYLRSAMGPQLANDIQPLIQNALQQAGAIQAYDRVLGQYTAIPFMPDVKADLQNYVTNKALDGIFYYVAQEEVAIRTNPAKRTTELLKRVFENQ